MVAFRRVLRASPLAEEYPVKTCQDGSEKVRCAHLCDFEAKQKKCTDKRSAGTASGRLGVRGVPADALEQHSTVARQAGIDPRDIKGHKA